MGIHQDDLFSSALEIAQQNLEGDPKGSRSLSLTSDPSKQQAQTPSKIGGSPIENKPTRVSKKEVDKSDFGQLVELLSTHVLRSDRILIISSGTKSKTRRIPKTMRLKKLLDIINANPQEFRETAIKARDLYAGKTHQDICTMVESISPSFDVDHLMISPFYGLISPYRKIIPYDCTFAGKQYFIQVQMAIRANIPFRLQQTILQPEYDVIVLALPKSYQVILDLLSKQVIVHKTVYKLEVTSSGYDLISLGL